MSEMIKLRNLCTRITDGSHYSPLGVEKGYPMLSVKDMGSYDFNFDNCKYISEDEYQSMLRNDCVPKKNDIVIAKDGSYLKEIFVITEDRDIAILSSIGILRPNLALVDPYYLKYYLSSDYVRKLVGRKYVTGSALQRIILENFGDIDIPYVSLDRQHAIVALLKDIDSKIANNNAICFNLEAMAKLLYDYWFVQFDFPDENGKPYKSSGGKMVWNEDLKREIPEGWHAGALGDVIEKYTNGISSSDIGDLPYTPMDILPMRQMSFSEIGSQEDANSSLIRYKKYSLLFGAMRPYFHRVCIAPFDGITRTTVFTLRERGNGELGYAFETLNQDYTVRYANAHHVGTQQPYAEWDDNLEKCPIPLPPVELRRKYSQMISDHIDDVIERNLENQQLASLRDFLLPMLMNGQVKVG